MEAGKLGHQSTMTSTSQTAPKSGMLEFDISILPSKADSTAPSSRPPAEPIRTASGCDPVLSSAPAKDGAAVGATTQSKSALTFDRDALSLDLAANPSWQTQSISEQLETSMELAKQFIEIGELQGARSMLDEVIANGSEEQRNRAQAMLAKLK
jgi:pilus assembly protein FimV